MDDKNTYCWNCKNAEPIKNTSWFEGDSDDIVNYYCKIKKKFAHELGWCKRFIVNPDGTGKPLDKMVLRTNHSAKVRKRT